MMITPEMMEQLGGKRGTPRGPDMTHREISDLQPGEQGSMHHDGFGGAESLDDAVGDWNDGRSKGRRKRIIGMRRALKRDKAFDEFAAANDRLDGMVANLRSYINSLRQFCDCHSAFSASLVDGLSGFGSVAVDVNAYHAASQQWCRTSKVPHVDSSLHSKVEVALELAAIDPIVAHIEVRRSLQEQLATATGTNRKALLEEVELLSQSMGGVMKGPIRALRQAQVDLLGTAAAVARGDECDQKVDCDAQSEPPSAPNQLDKTTTPVIDRANTSAFADIWRAGSSQAAWPTESPAAMDCSRDAFLTVHGRFGWENGKRVFQVSLRNECSVAANDIRLTVLPCDDTRIMVTAVPLVLPRLQPHTGASTLVHVGLAEDADPGLVPPRSPSPTEHEDEDFDSFCAERLERSRAFTPQSGSRPLDAKRQDSAGSEIRRSTASWALDAASCSTHAVRFALQCRELPHSQVIEVQLPYHLLLHGGYSMPYDEFEHHWNLAASASNRSHTCEDAFQTDDARDEAARGYAKSLARRRAYSGTNRVCVRVEGQGPLIGWARFEDETLLSEVRAALLCNPAFQAKLPTDWVFVKRNAPVGKKAERKWTVENLGHEIVLRGKTPHPSEYCEPTPPAQVPSTGDRSATSDSIPHHPQDGTVMSRRTFVITTELNVTDLVQALARGGVTLAARVEQRKHGVDATEGLLRFGARGGAMNSSEGEQVVFLLQMERQVYLEEAEPEAEPMSPQAGQQRLQYDWCCSMQASRADLEPAFEACIRSLASGAPDLLEHVEIVGGGTAYYGDWAGVTLSEAQAGVGNDDGYIYDDYGGILQEQMLMDFLRSDGKNDAKVLAKAARGALASAGLAEDDWLRELANMRKGGQLDTFLEAAVAQVAANKRKSSSQHASYDCGDCSGVSLEDDLRSSEHSAYDYGDYGGVSFGDSLGDTEQEGYDYGDYGGVSLEEAAAFTSSEDDEKSDANRIPSMQNPAPPTAEQFEFMDREAAAMVARMEATNADVSVQIVDDMRRLMASNPNASLADWAARSEWARDTGGARDEDGSPLRAQEGAWRQLWAAAGEHATPIGKADNSIGAGDGSTVASSTEARAPALSDGGAFGGSKSANEDSATQRATTSPATSSSAAWLAQRHMNALMRGTSVGSTVRIAELGAMQQQTAMGMYEDPSLEDLRAERAAAALAAAGMAKTTSAKERSRRIAATSVAQQLQGEQQALDAELAETQRQLEQERAGS